MPTEKLPIHAVILAGGRGTRFWPRSRTRTPKQLLNIVGKETMLEQTVSRLRPLISTDRIWTVTNAEQLDGVRKQLPRGARKRILVEPVGRNTAAAIALAAFHIRHAVNGDALMAVLPADHFISAGSKYRRIVRAALEVAREPGRMVVLGVPPTRPETGFGYVEREGPAIEVDSMPVFAVKRFTEKPSLDLAKEYLASGNYHWNAGMFFWRVSTFLGNLQRFLPKSHQAFAKFAGAIGTRAYKGTLRRTYRAIENISVDYGILEPATRAESSGEVFVVPAEVGWSDIGSWAAVYELLAAEAGANVFTGKGQAIDASGSFLYSPKKFVAAIGVRDLVVVETADALLVCPRDRAQDVAKLVRLLEKNRERKLL